LEGRLNSTCGTLVSFERARKSQENPPKKMIRNFKAADAEGIRQLLSVIPEAAQWPPQDLLSSEGNSVLRVAEENGKVSGLIVFRIVADEAEILNLAVEPRRRRQGIASRLIEDAFAACKAAGVGTIFLEVRESNEAARNLYARMGFTENTRRPQYYRRPLEDALVLRRRIAEDKQKLK
jgi:[ribosomal protein S18]-alanine N-acetyltransferase